MINFNERKQYEGHYDAVQNHVDMYFPNALISVFTEIPVLDFRLDVYHIKPNDQEYEILLTTGLSSMKMNVSEIPEHSESYQFAELMTLIPAGLDFGKMYPSGSPHDWIIAMIKQAAKFPHYDDTWLGIGHTIQSDGSLKPYSESTEYAGCIVLPTVTLPQAFQKIKTKNGTINIYSLFPLYREEITFKIENGYNAFLQLIIDNNAFEVIDFERENYCD